MPVALHPAVSTIRRAPTIGVFDHDLRISPSLLHALPLTGTYASGMRASSEDRLPGSVPATIAAVIAFATTALYLGLISSQGDHDVLPVLSFAAYFGGLGVCALLGAFRVGPDRVVWLGAATGGLIGAGIVAIFSIGLLFLVAGFCALAAWMRASVGVLPRQQVFAAVAAVGVPLSLFLLVVLV